MELRKPKPPLEFKFEDVTFLVKHEATEEDRMYAQFSGEHQGGGQFRYSRAEFCRVIVQRMVIGWRGVTAEGKEVPYSFDLIGDLPRVHGRNIFIELGGFIIKNTDIAQTRGDAKNASGRPQNGASVEEASTAAARTA